MLQLFWWIAYNFGASHTKRGTKSAVPLQGSIWLKSTEQNFSLSLPSPHEKLAWTPTSQHTSAFIAQDFFLPLSNPRLVITIILLYDTLQMSLLLFKDWVSGAHIQGAEVAFWVLSAQIGNKVVWRLLHLSHLFFFFEKFKNYLYVQRNQPCLMNFTETIQCHRMTQALCTTCWFVTNHRCIMWMAKTIRRFNLAGQDQQFSS